MDDAKQGDGIKTLLVLLAVVALTAAAYSNAMDGEFIMDDQRLIVENSAALTDRPLTDWFLVPFWRDASDFSAGTAYYRPVISVSYALDLRLYGKNPTGFHLTNIFFHIVNCCLLFLFMRKLGAGIFVSGTASALWGVMPRLT